MASKSNEILAKVLAMNEAQLAKFLSGLSPSNLAYLDVILAKAETQTPRLKKYLDK